MTRLLPVLALLVAGIAYWSGHNLKDALYEANLEVAQRSSKMAVNAVESAMVNHKSEDLWDGVAKRISRIKGTDIAVVNNKGQVLFSTDAEQRGGEFEASDPLCAECHTDGNQQPTTGFKVVRGSDDAPSQVFVAPLRNRQGCRGCHSRDGAKLGMVMVQHDLGPAHARIRNEQIGIAIVGVITILLTLLLTRLLIGRYLDRPLKRLIAGAQEIGDGNLEHEIKLPERTELTVLADTLNNSTKRLAATLRQLEKRRDNLALLYRFANELSRTVLPVERRRRGVELANAILDTECILVHATFDTRIPTPAGTVTYQRGEKIVDRPLPSDPGSAGMPSFYSAGLVDRWLRGEFSDQAEVREGATVAYPLQRHGRRVGLVLVPAGSKAGEALHDDDEDNLEMVRSLFRYLAVALEFSDIQTELVEQERLVAVGETVAGMTHCMKNILNGLRAGQYVIERGLEKNEQEKVTKGWRVMKSAVQQVEKLTFDMLYNVKDRVPDLQATDPNAIILEVIELLRVSAADQGVELRAQLDEQIGEQELDRSTIYRAVLNLATNAVDACVESEDGDLVTLRSQGGDDEIILSVEDNGIGMSDQVRLKLFRRFFSTKTSKGTGLGLAVVKKITEEHGGFLDVESEPGKGSTFHIHLPRNGGASIDAGA
jgi:signal transduction histidine kinase/HAMP domain-containing protein